jgi:hypothetical protein
VAILHQPDRSDPIAGYKQELAEVIDDARIGR